MNGNAPRSSAPLTYVVGIVGALLIVFILVRAMQSYLPPAPLGTERAAERMKNLTELRQAEVPILDGYAWQDQGKGLVRLPIEEAMSQVVRMYQQPDSARARLIERSDKASAPPPEVPSVFE